MQPRLSFDMELASDSPKEKKEAFLKQLKEIFETRHFNLYLQSIRDGFCWRDTDGAMHSELCETFEMNFRLYFSAVKPKKKGKMAMRSEQSIVTEEGRKRALGAYIALAVLEGVHTKAAFYLHEFYFKVKKGVHDFSEDEQTAARELLEADSLEDCVADLLFFHKMPTGLAASLMNYLTGFLQEAFAYASFLLPPNFDFMTLQPEENLTDAEKDRLEGCGQGDQFEED